MKKILQLAFLLLPFIGMTQVGIGTASPDASAVLDINSEISAGVRGGLKLPTVANDTERGMIDLTGNPVGLMIYNQNSRCVEMYDAVNMNWVDIQCLPALPQTSLEFLASTSSIDEDDAGGTIDVSVSITNPSLTNDTTVEVALSGTATNGNDYASIISPVTLTFPAGASPGNQSITIDVTNDGDTEGDETVILTLQNPTGGISNSAIIAATNPHTLTIVDDEGPTNDLPFQESFETDGNTLTGGARYTTTISEFTDNVSSSGNDYFIRTDGSNIADNSSSPDGLFYFAAQDIDGEGASSNQRIDFNGINITGGNNLQFEILLSAVNNSGFDAADFFTVQYQIDGGGYSNLLSVRIDSSEIDGVNGPPSIDTDFDGTGDGTLLTSTFVNFSSNIIGVGSTLDIRIEYDLDSGNEDIAIDNIRITSN